MNGATQTAPPAAPWRNRMVPGTAPAPIYADDPPLYDGRRAAPPVLSANQEALFRLHAPASISRRAAIARQDRPASGPPAEPDRTTGAAGTGESMGDFMQRAQEALTNEGNRWTPKEGDVLAGTLVRIRTIEGQWSDFRVAVIRPTAGGAPIEVAEKAVLKEAMDEMQQLGTGCQVAIKYLGQRDNKSGSQTYHAYTHYVEPAAAPVTNGQQTAAAPAAQPAPVAGTGTVADPTPEDATDAATMTALAKAALETGNQDTLAKIGAQARKIGMVWDRAAQRYNAPAPAADAVL